MAKKNKAIPLLEPLIFKERLIENKEQSILTSPAIDKFFIHSFKDDVVELKLPLPPHRKTVHDFVLVLNGKMTKTMGLEQFSMTSGNFLFTPKNSITTTDNVSQDLEGFYCHFSDDFLIDNHYLKSGVSQTMAQSVLSISDQQMERLIPLLNRMLSLYKEADSNSLKLIPYYLATFLAEISQISERTVAKHFQHPVLSKFTLLVNEHFKMSRQISFYSDLIPISPNHLNKIVKKETGKTASEVINELSILEAKVLLTQTRMEVSEIASELGFEDVSYFSRFFKKHSEISPSIYRKKIDLSK